MKNICITGSTGFLGQHVVRHLTNAGYALTEITRTQGRDICDWATVSDLEPCDVVVHLAAKTFVPDSFDNPQAFYTTNLVATINAMELSRQWDARTLFISSYFYGPPQYLPVDEAHPLHPHNPYAQTKLISEQIIEGYCRDFKIPAIALRLFNLYGPGQDDSFLIPTILKQVNSGHVELKDPRPKRDFIHVFDVVSAIQAAIESNTVGEGFRAMNLGSGKSYSVEDIVNIFSKHSPVPFTVHYSNEYRQGEVMDSVSNNSAIEHALGWKPTVSMEAGIKTLLQ